jgi:hypothetical protein
MKAATALRAAAIAEIPLLLVGIGITVLMWDSLPPELAEYQENVKDPLTDEAGSLPVRGALAIYLLATAGCWIAGLIGLMRLRTWGAWFYLISVVASLPSCFLFGYDISQPLEQAYYQACLMVSGGMLGLAFFSDALPWKSRAAVPEDAQGEMASKR